MPGSSGGPLASRPNRVVTEPKLGCKTLLFLPTNRAKTEDKEKEKQSRYCRNTATVSGGCREGNLATLCCAVPSTDDTTFVLAGKTLTT